MLLSAFADEALETNGVSEGEEPIETHLNMVTNDPRNVRKSDYEQRSQDRKLFRSSRSR